MKKTRIKRATPCRKALISTPAGSFSLALPYSIGRSFTIGHVTFEHNGSSYRPDREIPASWFIDLSTDSIQ